MWKAIDGHETYEVSDQGEVSNKLGQVLKPQPKRGYHCVQLYRDGKSKLFLIHRLVAGAFLDNPENLPQVDHINNIRSDNRLENLRWVNQSQNNQNTSMQPTNTSGFKGVYLNKKAKKWTAFIHHDGIKIYLGLFDKIDEAHQARLDMVAKLFTCAHVSES